MINVPAELVGGLLYQFPVFMYGAFSVSVNTGPARVYIIYDDVRDRGLDAYFRGNGWTIVKPQGFTFISSGGTEVLWYSVKLVSSPTTFSFPSVSSQRLMGVVIVSEAHKYRGGELEGFEVRVGNWPTWEQNPACATGQRAPTNGQQMNVPCQAEGRYVFVVLPGMNRTLVLCDVEVIGLSNAASSTVINGLIPQCTSCISGTRLRLLPLAQDLPVRMG